MLSFRGRTLAFIVLAMPAGCGLVAEIPGEGEDVGFDTSAAIDTERDVPLGPETAIDALSDGSLDDGPADDTTITDGTASDLGDATDGGADASDSTVASDSGDAADSGDATDSGDVGSDGGALVSITIRFKGGAAGGITSSYLAAPCQSALGDCVIKAPLGAGTIDVRADPAEGAYFDGFDSPVPSGCAAPRRKCNITVGSTVTANFKPLGGARLAFLSSTLVKGDFAKGKTIDQVCKDAARLSGLPSWDSYRTLISTRKVNARLAFPDAKTSYRRMDGRLWTLSSGELLAGKVFYPLAFDENGVASDLADAALNPLKTATNEKLEFAATSATDPTGGDCNEWSGTSVYNSYAGDAYGGPMSAISGRVARCDSQGRLICFDARPGALAPAPSKPSTPYALVFTAVQPTPKLLSFVDADALCTTEGRKVAPTGNFRALMASKATSAYERLTSFGLTATTALLRPDWTSLGTWGDLKTAPLTGPWTLWDGSPVPASVTATPPLRVQFGAQLIDGKADDNCGDWKDSPSGNGRGGDPTILWQALSVLGPFIKCADFRGVYCVQTP